MAIKLKPKTIRSSPTIGRISVSLERSRVNQGASTIYTSYIDGIQLIVGMAPTGAPYSTAERFRIENCIDGCLAHNGTWHNGLNGEKQFYTTGEPWIAYIDVLHNLWVQEFNGARVLLAKQASTVTIIRGWRHATDETIDQGLIVVYFSNGAYHSRAYIQKEWSVEELIPELGGTKTPITCWRTNDYRVGIKANGVVLITERLLAGLGIDDEIISLRPSIATANIEARKEDIKLVVIDDKDIGIDTVKLTPYISEATVNGFVGCLRPITIIRGSNVLGTTIVLAVDTAINFVDLATVKAKIKIKDSLGKSIAIKSYVMHGFNLKLSCVQFNNAVGLISIEYLGGLSTTGGILINPFKIQFMPVGLVPFPEVPINIIGAINVEVPNE